MGQPLAVLHWLTDPLGSQLIVRAVAELALLGIVSGALGCWLIFSGLSYSAESLAHGMFPGLVVAALLGVPLVVGGAAGLLVAALAIAAVGRVPRLDGEVAVAVVISTLFGLGVLLGLAPATPAGLGDLLFGNVLGATDADLVLAGVLGIVVTGTLAVLHPTMLAVGFDRRGAAALGHSAGAVDVVLGVLLAAATLVAVSALGNLLVVAILVAPAATARLLTHRMRTMMVLATGIAVAASIAGLYASYYADIAAGAAVTATLAGGFLMVLAVVQIRPPARAVPSGGGR